MLQKAIESSGTVIPHPFYTSCIFVMFDKFHVFMFSESDRNVLFASISKVLVKQKLKFRYEVRQEMPLQKIYQIWRETHPTSSSFNTSSSSCWHVLLFYAEFFYSLALRILLIEVYHLYHNIVQSKQSFPREYRKRTKKGYNRGSDWKF